MSATNRGGERVPLDVYSTPEWCVQRLLEEAKLPVGTWFEPCAGDGAIIRATLKMPAYAGVSWKAQEIRPETAPLLEETVGAGNYFIGDFLAHPPKKTDFSVILTNPPYMFAAEFIEQALHHADNVVMLLRMNFLASMKRHAWLSRNMPNIWVLPNRPSFILGGTDSCEYAWMQWSRNFKALNGMVRILALTPPEDRRRMPAPAAVLSLPPLEGTTADLDGEEAVYDTTPRPSLPE